MARRFNEAAVLIKGHFIPGYGKGPRKGDSVLRTFRLASVGFVLG
jgi:hypothetical protein